MQNLRLHGLVLAFYLGVSGLALYNIALHFGSHVPGAYTTDYFHFHWNYWWMRHALSEGIRIYETNYVMFPFTTNLAFHTLTPFWLPLWLLLEPPFGTIAALNTMFFIIMTLSGYLTFLLLRREGALISLALLGGAAFMVTPFILHSVYWSVLSMLGWFWLPAQMLLWGQIVDRADNLRRALPWVPVMGVALWAMGLTDPQYFIFGAFLIVPYGLRTLWMHPEKRGRLIGLGVLALVVGLALLWFIGPLPYALDYDQGTLAPGSAETAFDLEWPGDYFLGRDNHDYHPTIAAYTLPLWLLTMVLYLVPRIRRRILAEQHGYAFWCALVILPLLLSAGATVRVLGVAVPMPFQLLYEVGDGLLRFPLRFSVVFVLAIIAFVTLTFTPLLRGRSAWILAMSVPAFLLILGDVRVLRPMDTQPPIRTYDFYAQMGAEPYDYVIIEAPTAAGSGEVWVGDFDRLATQFHAVTHGKQLVNGHFSRVPIAHFWYLRTDDPLLSWLGQRARLDEVAVTALLQERIFGWPVGYIVIYQDAIGRYGPTNQEIIGFFNQLDDLLCPPLVEADAVVYRTAWHPDGCETRTPPQDAEGAYIIDIGAAADERYLGWGWHGPESIAGLGLRWMGQYPQADLYLALPQQAYSVEISAQAFTEPRMLSLQVDGMPVGDPVTVGVDALQAYRFDLAADMLPDDGDFTLTLAYDAALVPAEIGAGGDERPLALLVDWVRFIGKP